MNAFFLIDKPSGLTSFGLLQKIRRAQGIKKIGHTGTLDPGATGCMLVALGEYTKCISMLEGQDKTYIADIMLDGVSDSYDIDTEVRYISKKERSYFQDSLSIEQIIKIFDSHYNGEIVQIPPKYSALKINGKRALDRTLAGEEIKMKERKVKIYSYNIIDFNYPLLRVELQVSSGTYIRSIAYDLGVSLGTGGYLSALQRTKIAHLDIDQALSYDEITKENELILQKLFGPHIVQFGDEAVYKRLGDGQRVRGDFPLPKDIKILLFDGNNIRYIVEYKEGVLHPRKKIT